MIRIILQATAVAAFRSSTHHSGSSDHAPAANPDAGIPAYIDLTQTCSSYQDCYNCTLSTCDWSNGACTNKAGYDDEDYRPDLTVADFFMYGAKCEDTESLC